jgi:hypothetical protein
LPKSLENVFFKSVILDQFAKKLLDACDVGKGCVFHQLEEVLYLFLFIHAITKKQFLVVIDDCLLYFDVFSED